MPDQITTTLRAALSRLEAERQRIDRQIAAIRTALGGVADGGRGPARRRRRMSPAARRAVSQRMKAYWAERRGAKGGAKGASSAKATKAKAKSDKPAAK